MGKATVDIRVPIIDTEEPNIRIGKEFGSLMCPARDRAVCRPP